MVFKILNKKIMMVIISCS